MPRSINSLYYKGRALRAQGEASQAIACYISALRLNPHFVEAYGALANALCALHKPREAQRVLEVALTIDDRFAGIHNTLGVVYEAEGQTELAKQHLRRAMCLQPEFAELYNNYGLICWKEGNFTEARRYYERTLALDRQNVEAQWNLGIALLLAGRYKEGWPYYELRWKRKNAPRNFPRPLWQGEALWGRRILLHAEQGLGDTLQFLRFVPLVVAAGGRVILDVPHTLGRLASQIPGLDALTLGGGSLPEFDLHSPLMSLPRVLGITLENLPIAVSYLEAPQPARQKAAALDWPAEGLRVGVAWMGSPRQASNQQRSIRLTELAPLLGLAGTHFFSLQLGDGVEQLADAPLPIFDLAPYTADMADTAAQMEQLDLVITVDTAVAHMAGVLGRPVWLLLPRVPDWRWMLERDDSPWYPSMKLFRQQKSGDWASVVDRVRDQLQKLAHQVKTPSR
jgi:tetratricopeptide (TPR) repeat protein